MHKTYKAQRLLCLLLVAILAFVLCSTIHECHETLNHDCAVCLVLSVWKLALPGLLALVAFGCRMDVSQALLSAVTSHQHQPATLVAWKVKLSD